MKLAARKRYLTWLDVIALLAMMAWAMRIVGPYFDPGYPSSWDGAAHFVRLKAMAELFMPRGRTDGWCPYWYNGFVPFLFYPNLFFVLTAGIYHALGGLVPLLLVFKIATVSPYVYLPLAMYIMARCFRFTRFAALCAALCSLGVSAPQGIGLAGLFIIGLIPNGFALPLFLLALGSLHLGMTLGGRFVYAAAMLSALVVSTHLISGVYLTLAGTMYLVVACLWHRRPRRTLRRAIVIGLLSAGMCAATLLPMIVHRSLRGPGAGFGDIAFFRDFLQGTFLGGRGVNWLALAFVLGIRRRRFEETFLVILALLTLPFALGVILTKVPLVDNFLFQLLRGRTFAFLGLLVALFAGGACEAIRRFVSGHVPASLSQGPESRWPPMRRVSWLAALVLGGFLIVDVSGKIEELKSWVQVDAHYNTPEKWQYLDAYRWLREHTPRPAVIGFDDRFKEFGNPGYNQMASRIVLEADRFSLPGNQVEATRALNAEVLSHLHDWDPRRIHQALVRYNVSFLLTWPADVEANLRRYPGFALVYRNAKVRIWAVREHEFRFASGPGVQINALDFSIERITWTLLSDAAERPVTLAVASHPNWRARLNDAPISIRETEDHLMEVRIPRGSSTLTLAFRRAWWETLLLAISVTTFGVSLLLWLRGCQKAR